MVACCLSNRFADLAEHQRGRFDDLDGTYSVTVGTTYSVVGMGVWENVLHFLVQGDLSLPEFIPAGLFQCESQALPESWQFSLLPGIAAEGAALWENPCSALWGYSDLVRDAGHAQLLGERDPGALATFRDELRKLDGDDN